MRCPLYDLTSADVRPASTGMVAIPAFAAGAGLGAMPEVAPSAAAPASYRSYTTNRVNVEEGPDFVVIDGYRVDTPRGTKSVSVVDRKVTITVAREENPTDLFIKRIDLPPLRH